MGLPTTDKPAINTTKMNYELKAKISDMTIYELRHLLHECLNVHEKRSSGRPYNIMRDLEKDHYSMDSSERHGNTK